MVPWIGVTQTSNSQFSHLPTKLLVVYDLPSIGLITMTECLKIFTSQFLSKSELCKEIK